MVIWEKNAKALLNECRKCSFEIKLETIKKNFIFL